MTPALRVRGLVGRFYTGRLYAAWSNRCPRCLVQPFHGDSNALESQRRPEEAS